MLFIGIVSVLTSEKKVEVSPQSVLVINLGMSYPELDLENPFDELTGEENKTSLFKTIQLIEHASKDSLVKCIYLISKDNPNGFASSEEIKKALEVFKKSGKFIVAYGDYISQKAYLISHIADSIYVNPKGAFEWQGLSVESVFFKDLIDRLEIKPQIFYAGKFKSATEPFRATGMSDANRLQTSEWLFDLYGQMIQSISRVRKIDTSLLKDQANRFLIQTPEDAYRAKLIDGLKYEDEVRTVIQKKIKLDQKSKINFINLADYDKAVNEAGGYKKDKIALVVAEGEIVYGKGNLGQVSSNEYISLLRKIRNDKSIKAVVLRINSPGGSSLASELIWREMELIKKEGKKVMVSMGDVAASGGYYIAANANAIYVQPNTITGSIGVFSIVPDFSSFMKSKLGVTFDRVKTSEFSDLPSVTRSMSPAESAIIQQQVDRIYMDFKSRVADGRKKQMNYVDSIAQGRVWTGRKAIELGLADQIGGIEDAVKAAAKEANLTEYKIKTYPEPKNFLEMLLDKPVNDFTSRMMKQELGADHLIWQRVKSLKNERGEIKAQLPFEFSIR